MKLAFKLNSMMWACMVLFMAAGLIVACSAPIANPLVPVSILANVANTPVAVPTVEATPTTSIAGLGKTSTYQDSMVGFELDYPANWRINNVNDKNKQSSYVYSVTLISWTPSQDPQNCFKCQSVFPAGGTKIDIVVFNSGVTTLNEAILLRKREFAQAGLGQKVLTAETWTLNKGLIAQRWLVESQSGQSAELIAAINKRTVILGGLGDYVLFDAVARTLRRVSK